MAIQRLAGLVAMAVIVGSAIHMLLTGSKAPPAVVFLWIPWVSSVAMGTMW